MSGLNTSSDRAWWDAWFQRRPLSEEERRALGLDPLVRRILSLPGDDATREGWTVVVDDDDLPPRAEVSKTISDYEERGGINLAAKIRDASLRSRQYGAALILLGIDDGRTPDQPVDTNRIKRIWWTAVVDWRDFDYGKVIGPRGETLDYANLPDLEKSKYEPGAERFGQIDSYLITDLNGVLPDGVRYGDGNSQSGATETLLPANITFHSDRVLWVPYDAALPLLDQMQDALAAYFRGMSGVSRAIDRASLLIWKIKDHTAKSWGENREIGRSRLREAMRSWSSLSAMVIDKTDEDLVMGGGGSTSGLDAAINPIMVWIAALAGIPVTVLWQVSPGGFGTGASERENWFDSVRADQKNRWTTLVRKFALLVIAAKDGLGVTTSPDRVKVKWHELAPASEAERADMLAKRADTVSKLRDLYIDSELRKMIPEIELDLVARRASSASAAALEAVERSRALTAPDPGEVDRLLKIHTALAAISPDAARALAIAHGTRPGLAAAMFPAAPLPLAGAPTGAAEETSDNPDGEGADPVADAPAPPPEPPSRSIPLDALPAAELKTEFGVPTRTISRMAEKGLIKRYIRVGGKPVFSRSEVIEAERRDNLTAEEREAEDQERAEQAERDNAHELRSEEG
jgi:hypothetical protein